MTSQTRNVYKNSRVRGRVPVTDHPLKSRSNSPVPDQILTSPKQEVEAASTHSSLTTTINTASLIQSAARSVLDSLQSPASTNVSDYERHSASSDIESHGREPLPSPTLQSLQRETPAAMPDEQDRKRFVGCLAAMLASAYDYDVAEAEEDNETSRAESYAYLNRSEQGRDSDEDDDEDEHFWRDSFSGRTDTFQHGEDFYLPRGCSESFEYPDSKQVPGFPYCHSEPNLDILQQQKQLPPNELKNSSQARNRHRKRRYNVLSKLLLSSAELLLLDKSQARAFLPMLARLLVPPSAQENAKADQIRQRKIQQQREQQWQHHLKQHQKQQQLHQQQLQQSNFSSPTKSTATNATSPNRSSTTSSSTEKGINHYHFSPSTTMPVSRTIPLPDSGMDLVEYGREEDDYFLPRDLDEEDHLKPFLESLSPGAGFRCLSLLLLQHLLSSENGYDARIRHVIKKLGVVVLIHDIELERELETIEDDEESTSTGIPNLKAKRKRAKQKPQTPLTKYEDLVEPATRKFEALENSIAVRLIRLSKEQQRLQKLQKRGPAKRHRQRKQQKHRYPPWESSSDQIAPAFSREQFMRGLKIGSAGLVAGTIFAVTGGLAAPGIAAGVAAIAGSTAATAAIATLVSSTTAVTAIFGVGGGSLAAYKMQRRMQGLTEFEFKRQDKLSSDGRYHENDDEEQAELFSTVCMSGWLRDEHDFQRPWGITPTNPRISDRLELLERFYSVYRPDHVSKCKKILSHWKGEERQLWQLLKQKYGRDPDHLYPLVETEKTSFHRGLTLEQEEVLDDLFVELGFIAAENVDVDLSSRNKMQQHSRTSALQSVKETLRHPSSLFHKQNNESLDPGHANRPFAAYHNTSALLDESVLGPNQDSHSCTSGIDSLPSSFVASASTDNSNDENSEEMEQYKPPKHLATVWDYHARYGGEMYTIKWESDMLIELCDSVTDLAFDVINGATAQILRQTAFSTLLSAVALPYALINAANMIDGTWTLAVERADEAGKELARSLLFSRAGHRPVTLVGFSFGARAIYSCLKELARFQEKWWENSREQNRNDNGEGFCSDGDPKSSSYSWTTREPASIVEDVILMGLPNHLSLTSWKACRQVVGGRLVNCYSRKDLILSLMFQFKRLAGALRPVCGTCAVDIAGVENVDVTDLVSGHQDYTLVTGEILKRVRHGQPFRSSVKVVSSVNGALQ